MSSPAERLEVFIRHRYKTKTELARILGINFSALDKYIGGRNDKIKKSVFGEKYRNILDKEGLNISWYLTGQGEMLKSGNNHNLIHDTVEIYNVKSDEFDIYLEVLPVPANAGRGYSFSDIPEEKKLVSRKYQNGNFKVVRVCGDSMKPRILDGDLLIVAWEREPQNNDVVIATINNNLVCKRFVITESKKMLHSDNPDYEPIEINGFNTAVIHGVVVEGTYKP